MKKLLLLLLLIQSTIVLAQVPQGFNYQATVRNSSGGLIINQNVNFKFNVMQNTPTSVPVYSETHLAPTDDLGAVNLVIGKGTATTGTFSNIDWANGTYYLGIELNTGSGYVAMGTSQLLSVPYALYAKSSGTNSAVGTINAISTVNGATITSGVLNLSPADASNGGVITTGIQTIAGTKTFNEDLTVNGITIGRGNGNQEYNNAVGIGVLEANTTGQWNVGLGYWALKSNTIGGSNNAIGLRALTANTTGNENNAIGDSALYKNTIGSQNIANGTVALGANTTGSHNVAIGYASLFENTTGNNNTAIGESALNGNILGNGNTAVGYAASTVGDLTNATAIGNTARAASSNTVQLGNTAVTSVNTSGNYTGKAFIKTGGTASQYLMADGSVSDTGSVSQNKGKTSIIIVGNFTNAQAAAQIAAEAGPYTENIYVENTTALTTVDLSAVTNLLEIYVNNNPALSSINLASLNFVYWDIHLEGNAFPSSQINSLLHKFLTLSTGGKIKYIVLNGQTPPAPPTGQGIIDKAALISAGWSVTTD
jgi:hypothetical protein